MPWYYAEEPLRMVSGNRPDNTLPRPERPVDPGYGIEGPTRPTLPPDWERPSLPPDFELPPLPPFFPPGVALPIPPSIAHPIVPIDPPDEVVDPPPVWPPLPIPPELPDISGKTLCLALFFIQRHVAVWRWVILDHAEIKEKAKAALEAIKGKLPAGGVGGRPPTRPTPR